MNVKHLLYQDNRQRQATAQQSSVIRTRRISRSLILSLTDQAKDTVRLLSAPQHAGQGDYLWQSISNPRIFTCFKQVSVVIFYTLSCFFFYSLFLVTVSLSSLLSTHTSSFNCLLFCLLCECRAGQGIAEVVSWWRLKAVIQKAQLNQRVACCMTKPHWGSW